MLGGTQSDPPPIPRSFFGNRYYASSEPPPDLHSSASKRSSKDEGRCCRRSRRELEQSQIKLKAFKEKAESRSVDLFHSYREAKKYDDAEKVYEDIWRDRDTIKSEDEVALKLKHSYAAMLLEQKKFQQAEPISRTVWEKRKQCPGPLSEFVKESHRQLCSVLCAVGKSKDAENMQRIMYQSGNSDPWALENGDEVCQRLKEQGEVRRAKELQGEVWEERRKQNPLRDGLTIRGGLRLIEFLEHLVINIDNQDGTDAERRLNNSHKQAFECEIEVVLRKIWDTRQHPESDTHILDAGHKLGVVVYLQDKFSDAESILIPVWEGRKQRLGDRDASTLSTGRMLGKTLCRQEDQEAYRRVVDLLQDIWQSMTKDGDAEAISSGEDLALAHRSIGAWPNAEPVCRWVFNQKKQKRYPTRDIEDAYWNLGQTLYKLGTGKHIEARAVLGELYQQWNARSADPSRTLQCGYMLAQLLSAQDGKGDEASKIASDVFSERRASVEKGVAYLDSGYLYGSLLLRRGKFSEAERTLKSVWEYQAIGDEEEKVRLTCGHLFGQALAKKGKNATAKKILEAVINAQEAVSAGVHEMEETRKLLREVTKKQRKALSWS